MKKLFLLLTCLAVPASCQFTNAKSIWGRSVTASAPADGTVLTWSASQSKFIFSLAGGANTLSVSGSIVGAGSLNSPIAGMSCGKVVMGFASLTGGSSTQEIPFLVVPAAWHIDMVRLNPATLFGYASVGTTLTASIQQQGNTASPDIIPATNIMTGATFLEDIPGNPNLSGHTISFNIIGDTTFTHLNAGSLEITYCGHVVL